VYPQVFGYAATVFLFWWVVLGLWGVMTNHINVWSVLPRSISILIMCGLGALMGIIGAVIWVVAERQRRRETLESDNVRGLTCTIGPVPLNAREPSRSKELPDFNNLRDVPPEFFPSWLSRCAATHPQHVALVNAMLRVYQASKHLPATHVVGGHGGRTLLEHSLLVAYQMQQLASKWSYTGLRDRTGKKVLLKLRDETYRFDASDPLVLIVGLAHDIGKIEAFIVENGAVVGSHHEHDLTGARMLARMPEMWDIPDADRVAILLSIAHYHHPMELPLSPDRRAIDDRTIAVMELLIKADFVASAIERKGVVPTEEDYNSEMDQREIAELTDERLWTAFNEILTETGRINSTDLNYNVGTICPISGQNSMRLVLHEPSIRGALMRRLGLLEGHQLGDGRYALTMQLLRLINEHQLLVTDIKDLSYPPESALWTVSFFGKKKTRGSNEAARLTGWPAAIVMLPTISPYVAALPSYPWTGTIDRGTMGEARSKSSNRSSGSEFWVAETPTAALKGDTEEEAIAPSEPQTGTQYVEPVVIGTSRSPSTKGKAWKPRTTKIDLAVLDQSKELMQDQVGADPKLQAAQNGQGGAYESAGTASPQTHHYEVLGSNSQGLMIEPVLEPQRFVVRTQVQQQKEPAKAAMSPYLLKQSVSRVINEEAMEITETGSGRKIYLVGKLHLVKHVPDVDWSNTSSEIIALCKSARGSGFETVETRGDLYLLVDALMIKEFMNRT
jgi:hypothetical protein